MGLEPTTFELEVQHASPLRHGLFRGNFSLLCNKFAILLINSNQFFYLLLVPRLAVINKHHGTRENIYQLKVVSSKKWPCVVVFCKINMWFLILSNYHSGVIGAIVNFVYLSNRVFLLRGNGYTIHQQIFSKSDWFKLIA